eukprot:716519-Prymnesium_polylepis.1
MAPFGRPEYLPGRVAAVLLQPSTTGCCIIRAGNYRVNVWVAPNFAAASSTPLAPIASAITAIASHALQLPSTGVTGRWFHRHSAEALMLCEWKWHATVTYGDHLYVVCHTRSNQRLRVAFAGAALRSALADS